MATPNDRDRALMTETTNVEAATGAFAEPERRQGGVLRTIGRVLGSHDGDTARVLIFIAIAAIIIAVAPNFASRTSWLALSQTATVVALLGLGQTFVIVTAGIDLSVGSVMACSAVVGAIVMRDMYTAGIAPATAIAVGAVVMIATGALAGVINGLAITRLHITPFIVTLGMLSVARGAMNVITGGVEVVGLPPGLREVGNYAVAGWLTIPVIVTIVAAVISWLVLTRTQFGLRSFAIGSNVGSARRAGIAVNRHLIGIYTISGIFAGIAGFLLTARLTNASTLAGQGMELSSIAAAVIGGASLFGGRGSVFGTMIGALIMAALQIGLVIAGVQSFWQTIAVGIITVAAVYGDQLRIKFSRTSG